MLTEDLDIYKAMYPMALKVIDARSKFDKTFKYTVGDKMVDLAMECLSLIHFANEDRRTGMREEHLNLFLIKFDILKTYIMVCRDRQQFKDGNMLADIFLLEASVENQATKWRNSTARASRKEAGE